MEKRISDEQIKEDSEQILDESGAIVYPFWKKGMRDYALDLIDTRAEAETLRARVTELETEMQSAITKWQCACCGRDMSISEYGGDGPVMTDACQKCQQEEST